MKIADLYIRVSTDEQADKGYSQRCQEDVLLKYCEINDIKVRKSVFEDHSAKTFERPEWKTLLVELKKYKGKTDLVLFTKWDRFSRNASDAYQMISTLRKIGVEPQAIEQPLDMNIPENKMMLAVYLTTPEIENDRRALNVKHGMRQARKEGRWMGVAPPGYANKMDENGRKYVAISEPQASHIRRAFEQIAEGIYSTSEIFKMAKKEGLSCSVNSFWRAIRNVGYCGKVIISAYKNEEAYLVKGLHDAIISESLFYDVQDVLTGRNREIAINGVTIVSQDNLPLRGFLNCSNCSRVLTGSASKGRNGYYHYYHCSSTCGIRYNAKTVNMDFVRELRKYIPKPGMAEVFKEVVCDLYKDGRQLELGEKKIFISQITENNNRITKARELLLNDGLDQSEYKMIKKEAEEKIVRLEAKLNDFAANSSASLNIEGLVYKAVENLQKLDLLYLNADIEGQRFIIGSMFPEKWTYSETGHRTGIVNQAALLIYQINSSLEHKKTRIRTTNRTVSGFVLRAGIEPALRLREQDFKSCVSTSSTI
jgi:site-specific DNA recombinase